MVDLIITDSKHVDVRSAVDYTLDCAWGKEENDFELVVSGASTIDAGAYIYIDGSECGGVVDAMEDQLTAGVSTLTYSGRTWHGVLANKILEPDRGRDYLTVSGTDKFAARSSAASALTACSTRWTRPLPARRPSKATGSTATRTAIRV